MTKPAAQLRQLPLVSPIRAAVLLSPRPPRSTNEVNLPLPVDADTSLLPNFVCTAA